MKSTFKQLITDFTERDLEEVKAREVQLDPTIQRVQTITGARRTGKTYLLYYTIRSLRQSIPDDRIVYINFEDDRLFPLELNDLSALVEAYYELFPHNKKETVHFFFDEMQNVPHWEKFIRRLFDTEQCQIYITGSSSNLLHTDVATALRGRTYPSEVFPISFREFTSMQNLDYNPHSSEIRAHLVHLFHQYFSGSAFPELLIERIEDPIRLLQEYLDLIIFRDVIERYNFSNHYLVRFLVTFLLRNIGNLFSINKIYRDFRSRGVKVSKDSLYQLMEHLQEVYTFFPVRLFTHNIRVQQQNPVKMYVIDPFLKSAVSTQKDTGRKLENLVFLDLRRFSRDIWYYRNEREVDFVVKRREKLTLVNVCYDLSDAQTLEREKAGLMEGMKDLAVSESYLITAGEEQTVQQDEYTINIVPFWKWTLDSSLNPLLPAE